MASSFGSRLIWGFRLLEGQEAETPLHLFCRQDFFTDKTGQGLTFR